MGLMVQIYDVRQLDDGVWKARLSTSELCFLDPKAKHAGPSILLFTEDPSYDHENRCLSFNPSTVKLLNAGTSDTAILVGGKLDATQRVAALTNAQTSTGSGDAKFLQSLPPELKELGTQLLREVRSHFRGDLVYRQQSKKYVESPDNFWTIIPQSQDRSFRITVRGRPESFHSTGTLELKPDRSSYSSFKIKHCEQIEEFIRVLKQVRRK